MFDISSPVDLGITGFEMHFLNSGANPYAIYYRVGTWVGGEDTLPGTGHCSDLGTVNGSSGGPSNLISLTTPLDLTPVRPTEFYLTSTTSSTVYSTGTAVGAVAATNGVLTVFKGTPSAMLSARSSSPGFGMARSSTRPSAVLGWK